MNEIMSGETTATQNAAFLAALSTKSARAETTDEIAGCAAAMRAHAMKVETGTELFEIVGTGGDNAHSFNISTTSALVAAAGGMKVAKHGNRAASSQCGTADCLEALGVNIQQSPERCLELLDEVGMCFFSHRNIILQWNMWEQSARSWDSVRCSISSALLPIREHLLCSSSVCMTSILWNRWHRY